MEVKWTDYCKTRSKSLAGHNEGRQSSAVTQSCYIQCKTLQFPLQFDGTTFLYIAFCTNRNWSLTLNKGSPCPIFSFAGTQTYTHFKHKGWNDTQAHLKHVWALQNSETKWLPTLWNALKYHALIKDHHFSYLDEVKCWNGRGIISGTKCIKRVNKK